MINLERTDKIVYGILGGLILGTLLYIVVLGLTGAIDILGGAVSAAGWNVVDGIHIHKSFFGLLAMIAGLYMFVTWDCSKDRWISWLGLFIMTVGVIIVSFDYAVWGVTLPITLV